MTVVFRSFLSYFNRAILFFVQIFDVESGRYLGKDRDHYKQLSVEQSNQTIDWFVSQIPTEKGAVIDAFVSKMKQLENWFDQDNLNRFEFISSSLLFAFSKSNSNQMQVDLRMIDFAHVFPLAGSKCLFEGMANQDHNYLFGLRNLIKLFIQIRAQL